MSHRFRKTRQVGRGAPLRPPELLESRSLLSAQGLEGVVAPQNVSAAPDALIATEAPTSIVAMTVKVTGPALKVSLHENGSAWLSYRAHSSYTFVAGASQSLRIDPFFSELKHDVIAQRDHSLAYSSKPNSLANFPKMQLAPFEGRLEYFLPPNGVVHAPGFAVAPTPNGDSRPGTSPGHNPGAILSAAAHALIQALASMHSIATAAEPASLLGVAAVDSRPFAVTTTTSQPPPALTAVPAPLRSSLNASPDAGFATIGSPAEIQPRAVDALLDSESPDALTDAELDWLNPRPDLAPASVVPDLAQVAMSDAASGVTQDLAIASADTGMMSLARFVDYPMQISETRIVQTAASPVEMTGMAAVFQALASVGDQPARIVSAQVSTMGVGERRTETAGEAGGVTGLSSWQATIGITLGLAGTEFIRRRKHRRDNLA